MYKNPHWMNDATDNLLKSLLCGVWIVERQRSKYADDGIDFVCVRSTVLRYLSISLNSFLGFWIEAYDIHTH